MIIATIFFSQCKNSFIFMLEKLVNTNTNLTNIINLQM